MNSTFNWVGFDGQLQNIQPVHQGPLANIAPMPIAQGLVLAPGVYNIWFAVDYPMDGVLDLRNTAALRDHPDGGVMRKILFDNPQNHHSLPSRPETFAVKF